MTREEIIIYIEKVREKLNDEAFWHPSESENRYLTKNTCLFLFDKILEKIKED